MKKAQFHWYIFWGFTKLYSLAFSLCSLQTIVTEFFVRTLLFPTSQSKGLRFINKKKTFTYIIHKKQNSIM